MKEMKYSSSYKEELLDSGEYKGYKYYIISLGWHPCAYIEIPIENEAYGCTYQCYPVNGIQCHGGIRYSKSMLSFPEVHGQGWFIGWDYAHHGDFSGIISFAKGKQWTVAEIIKDVHCVIEQLKGEMKHGGNSNRR